VSKRSDARHLAGILLLDKPSGLTSNRALQRVKRLFGVAKAGHSGSLDPLATGMLPISFGGATRLNAWLLDAGKVYRVTSELGVAMDTGDADGQVVAQGLVPALDAGEIEARVAAFVGEITQVPPMYSALKHKGRRLYELARKGEEVQREPRRVRIEAITELSYEPPALSFTVRCSKGTYVRTLVEDIAIALGTVGHVTALRRLAVEPFSAEPMHSLESLEEAAAQGGTAALDALLLPMDRALVGWPGVTVSVEQADRLSHGQSVDADPAWPAGLVKLYASGGQFFGIGEVGAGSELAPRRILAAPELGASPRVQVQYRASQKG
jgi:tRNA pseudouridine55 synthase